MGVAWVGLLELLLCVGGGPVLDSIPGQRITPCALDLCVFKASGAFLCCFYCRIERKEVQMY